MSQPNEKMSTSIKNYFKTSISDLKNDIKTLRNHLSHKLSTKELKQANAIDLDLVDHITSKNSIDVLKSKNILISKSELIWVMDNIHSNEVIIDRLKRKCNFSDKVLELNEDNQRLNRENDHYCERLAKLKSEIKKYQEEIKILTLENKNLQDSSCSLAILLDNRNKSFEEMVRRYEEKLCENEIRHAGVIDLVSAGKNNNIYENDFDARVVV